MFNNFACHFTDDVLPFKITIDILRNLQHLCVCVNHADEKQEICLCSVLALYFIPYAIDQVINDDDSLWYFMVPLVHNELIHTVRSTGVEKWYCVLFCSSYLFLIWQYVYRPTIKVKTCCNFGASHHLKDYCNIFDKTTLKRTHKDYLAIQAFHWRKWTSNWWWRNDHFGFVNLSDFSHNVLWYIIFC